MRLKTNNKRARASSENLSVSFFFAVHYPSPSLSLPKTKQNHMVLLSLLVDLIIHNQTIQIKISFFGASAQWT